MSLGSPDRLAFMVRFVTEPMICDSPGTDMQEANSGYAGLGLRENASRSSSLPPFHSPLSPSFSLLSAPLIFCPDHSLYLSEVSWS